MFVRKGQALGSGVKPQPKASGRTPKISGRTPKITPKTADRFVPEDLDAIINDLAAQYAVESKTVQVAPRKRGRPRKQVAKPDGGTEH